MSNQQIAVSARFWRRACALACLATLSLCSSTKADPVLIFGQNGLPTDGATLINGGGGTSTIVTNVGNPDGGGISIPVLITTYMNVGGLAIPAFETFVGVMSTGPAMQVVVGGVAFDFQSFSGEIRIDSTPGGLPLDGLPIFNYLTATFTATLSGQDGGTAATFSAAQPPGSLSLFATGTPAPGFIPIAPGSPATPTAMALGFSNLTQPLTINGGSLGASGNTTMAAAGNFSGTIVPEPSTMALAGLGALGLAGYGLRRRRASAA
jgi:hypothetical protein